MKLSTCLDKKVLQHYQHNNVVCPPSLKIGEFTTAAIDSIDHNPSSKAAEESFHSTGISLFQHPTKSNHGLEQFSNEAEVESDKLRLIPMSNRFHHSMTKQNIGTILMLQINQMILKLQY